MKNIALSLLTVAFALSAGSAFACNDPECPHKPTKPKIVAAN